MSSLPAPSQDIVCSLAFQLSIHIELLLHRLFACYKNATARMTYDSTTKAGEPRGETGLERAGAKGEVRNGKTKRRWGRSRNCASRQEPSAHRPPLPRPCRTQVRPFPDAEVQFGRQCPSMYLLPSFIRYPGAKGAFRQLGRWSAHDLGLSFCA